MWGIGGLFDHHQSDALAHDPSELMLDYPITMGDSSLLLSSTAKEVVSSSARSRTRNQHRQWGDKDTGPPEVHDEWIDKVSNHPFAHWLPTLVEHKASTPLQGAAELADLTWSKVRSTDGMQDMEHSKTSAGAGTMLRRWLDTPPRSDPVCRWTMRTAQSF